LKEQLALLPEKYISNESKLPLLFAYNTVKTAGETDTKKQIDFKYAHRPMWYGVIFLLLYQVPESFADLAIATTETELLLGAYQPSFSPHLSAGKATTYTNISIGVKYVAPIFGGIIADGFLGDYYTIICAGLLYIPGLLLISLSTFPALLGATFNITALGAGLFVLQPLGYGINKAVMNVFTAKQFYPIPPVGATRVILCPSVRCCQYRCGCRTNPCGYVSTNQSANRICDSCLFNDHWPTCFYIGLQTIRHQPNTKEDGYRYSKAHWEEGCL
jgi:hypothetical protein